MKLPKASPQKEMTDSVTKTLAKGIYVRGKINEKNIFYNEK